jgi:hypothetical protein
MTTVIKFSFLANNKTESDNNDMHFCQVAAHREAVALQNNLPLLKFLEQILQIDKLQYSCHSIPSTF